MSANTILTSIVTGGSNNHTTTAEEANAVRTDFGTAGIIGAIVLNTGSGGTGGYAVNQNTGSNLAINILAGKAQFFITPSSQGSQMLRPIAAADYTAYTINSNASGSTKYDWIYLSGNATNANNPSSTSDNVVSIVTSRSSSNTVDNGSAPTYGLLLAIVTVANAATAITNSNISDQRSAASLAASGGILSVTQSGTGNPSIIQAAGSDTNISLKLVPKGTGTIISGDSTLMKRIGLGTDTGATLTTSYVTHSTVTATSHGGVVELQWGAQLGNGNSGGDKTFDMQLLCDGVTTGITPSTLNFDSPFISGATTTLAYGFTHNQTAPTAASHVWALQFKASAGSSVVLMNSYLKVVEII